MGFSPKFCRVCILLLASVACFHRNRDAAVLAAALADKSAYRFSDEGIEAQYLTFEDALTASVFGDLKHRYRIAPLGTTLLCPSNPAAGMHGFAVRARLERITPGQAVAEIVQTCEQRFRTIAMSSLYLLLRRNRKWEVAKALEGSISTASMPTVAPLRARADTAR